jgi:hypothetical protein
MPVARMAMFLAAWPEDVVVAVEIRNKTWMTLNSSTAFQASCGRGAGGPGLGALAIESG